MADSSANIPQRPGWNAPNMGSAVEHATIGSSIVIKGEVSGNEALFVDGTIEGTINIPGYRVTVGRHSTVKADITAREVVVMGTVRGNIHCADLLDIRAESYLQGQVVTNRIRIDDGAVLRGSVEIQRAEKRAAAAASPVAAAPKKAEEAVAPAVKGETPTPATPAASVAPEAPTPAPEPKSEPAESDGAKALAAAVARRMAGTGGWFKSGR
jgi:cytoskeletal protein CcmA (bactofilin family)